MSGIAFLPDDDHAYIQAPYEEVPDDVWSDLAARSVQTADWSRLNEIELDDRTEGARELACSAGQCAI